MTEFELIQQYFAELGTRQAETKLSIGDDAAIIDVPEKHQLVISTDTMLEDVHFPASTPPDAVGAKLATVNLSDMAAMGATPKWVTLTLSLPNYNANWLRGFSKGLAGLLEQYEVELIGGDTTQGALNVGLQVMGIIEQDKALVRSGAQEGDDIYVSGCLGDAALGLQFALENQFNYMLNKDFLINKLYYPSPKVELGQALIGVASSCIDVSDGLLSELNHISTASKVGMEIELEQIPISKHYKDYIQQGGDYQFALAGGDDYELCFTASADKQSEIEKIAENTGISLSKIGCVDTSKHVRILQHGEPYLIEHTKSGYQHFTS